MADAITIDPSEFVPANKAVKINPKEFKAARAETPSSSDPIIGRPDVIGTTPEGGEISRGPGSVATGIEEALRTGAFAAGEAGGEAVGGTPGAAAGAGLAGTLSDAVLAYINHKLYGHDIDVNKKTLAEDFLVNAGTSLAGAGAGKLLHGGIPKEAQAVRDAAEHAQAAKAGFQEKVGDITKANETKLADLQESHQTKLQQAKEALTKQQQEAPAKIEAAKQKLAATTESQRQQIAKLEEQLPKKQESQLAAISPQAKLEAIQRTTGRTAETAAKATLPELDTTAEGAAIAPSPETLAKQGGPRGTYFAVRNRLGDAYGGQYEKILDKYGQNSVTDLSGLQGVVDRWKGTFAQEGREIPKQAKTLFEDAEKLAPGTGDPLDQVRNLLEKKFGYEPDTVAGMSNRQLENYHRQLSDEGLIKPEGSGATVHQVLAYKRAAQKLMVSATDDRTREIAAQAADAANDALGKTGGLPDDARRQLAALNTQYADYKRMFPRTDIRGMATTQTPIEAADRIFGNPTLTDRIVANAKPDELKTLQNAFGDWAQLHPGDLLAKTPGDAQIKSRVYGRLFPGTLFADPNALVYVGATLDNLSAAPQANAAFEAALQPEYERIAQAQQRMAATQATGQQGIANLQNKIGGMAQAGQQQMSKMQARFATAWQQAQQQALADGAKGVRDAGIRAAKELGGPAGDRLIKEINSASLRGGPQEAARVATQFFTGLTPEQFVQTLAKDQSRFGMSEAAKYSGKAGFGFWIKRMATDPDTWKWIMGMGGAQMLLTGHPSWYGEMGAVGAPMMLQRFVSNAFVKGLEDPAAARALLAGSKAARIGIMGPLASTLLKASTDEIGSRLAQRATGITMEPDNTESEDEKVAP